MMKIQMKRVIHRTVLAVGCMFVLAAVSAPVTIDVMFAYDQSAARWLDSNGVDGGELATRAVEKMNSVLPATHLDEYFTFRLVGMVVSSAEATGSAGQERLFNACLSVADAETGAATGAWVDVHAARDLFGADVVVVLVDSESGVGESATGVSWSLDSGVPDPSQFAPWAYSVCAVQDADTDYVIAHEVGHVMGAGHSDALEGDPGPQLYPYSSAWNFTDVNNVKYHTVMGYYRTSYSDKGYKPYPAFSSSEFTTPEGDPLGDALHDNTRTLRETCVIVSQFRNPASPAQVSAKFTTKKVVPCKVVDSEDNLVGVAQITIAKTDKKGKSKVSAVFYGLDGKKKSSKAEKAEVYVSDHGAAVKAVKLVLKGESDPLVVTVAEDGMVSGTFGRNSVRKAGSFGASSPSMRFRIAGMPDAIDGKMVMNDVESGGKSYHLLPDGDGVGFSVAGKKWVFAKAAGVKYVKDKETKLTSLLVDVGKDGSKTNLCGLKLSASDKTGLFKGSFVVYLKDGTAEKPKVKKCSFKVSGVLVDGAGFGRATFRGTTVDVVL